MHVNVLDFMFASLALAAKVGSSHSRLGIGPNVIGNECLREPLRQVSGRAVDRTPGSSTEYFARTRLGQEEKLVLLHDFRTVPNRAGSASVQSVRLRLWTPLPHRLDNRC